MNMRTLIGTLAFTTLMIPAVLAQQPCGGGYYGNVFFPGYGYNIYGMDSVPYFALHPPVYYSRPVPRSYGWSPFAYPPGVLTPEEEVKPVQPQLYRNPHVPQQSSDGDDNVAMAKPLVIVNPFATENASSGVQLSQTEQAD